MTPTYKIKTQVAMMPMYLFIYSTEKSPAIFLYNTALPFQVENFFRRVSSRFGNREPRADSGDILVNQDINNTDTQVVGIEESFNRLVSKVNSLVGRCDVAVSRMGTKLGKVFQNAFLNDLGAPMEETTDDRYSPDQDSGFLQGVGLEEVLGSFYDFGKNMLDEFGAVVTQVFDDISEVVQEKKTGNDAVLQKLQCSFR